jgi:hypothetical protein
VGGAAGEVGFAGEVADGVIAVGFALSAGQDSGDDAVGAVVFPLGYPAFGVGLADFVALAVVAVQGDLGGCAIGLLDLVEPAEGVVAIFDGVAGRVGVGLFAAVGAPGGAGDFAVGGDGFGEPVEFVVFVLGDVALRVGDAGAVAVGVVAEPGDVALGVGDGE